MGELFVRCNCGARLRMQSTHSGKTANCPKCHARITAPRPDIFDLWDGDEITLQQLMNMASFDGRRSTESAIEPRIQPAVHRPLSETAAELSEQFEAFVSLLQSEPNHPLFETPVSEWTEPSDTALPFKFLRWPLRKVLQTPFAKIATSWSSDERLVCLMDHLDRAQKTIQSRTGCPDENASDAMPVPMLGAISRKLTRTGRGWRTSCEIIERHRFQSVHLGMLAPSLLELPKSFWKRRIGEFSDKTLFELSEMPGLGAQKCNLIVDMFGELAAHLESIPSETHLATYLLPKPIQTINLWLEEVLGERRIPDFDEIATRFFRPLTMQLRIDLSDELASMVIRRIGADGTPDTLEQIAGDVGLTRERVRQITLRATEVVQVRWPHGKHLMDDFFDLLRSASDAERQLTFVRTILDRCFEVEFASGGSRSEVMNAWRDAGRKRLTPMREDTIGEWLAGQFPRIAPEVGVRWICEDAANASDANGAMWYFTDEPLDQLLQLIYEKGTAVATTDVVALLGGEARSLAGRIARDPRFVQIDDKRIHSSHHCSIERQGETWYLRLVPLSSTNTVGVEILSIENVVQLVIGGLTQIGIADASVWGVHRYVNDVLGRIYAAKLPELVSPFVLQDLLVGHSNDVIRRMRRRRLRWDRADGSIRVRGKRGWVGFAVLQAAIPMTLEELGVELRKYYQDYEAYVLQQLPLNDDDEGEGLSGVNFLPGIARRVPPIVLPDAWSLDLERENVSDAIKLIAGKIVDVGRKKGFPKSDLGQIPWLVELVEYYSYGKMKWSDEELSTDEIVAAGARAQRSQETPKAPSEDVWDVDERAESEESTLENIMDQLNDLL